MPKEIFSIPSLQFRVFQAEGGGFDWRGTYEGMKVVAAQPFEGNSRCLILLDPDASQKSYFENLLCVDASGKVLWRAQPPQSSNDAFVAIRMTGELYANTWSGYRVRIDLETGRTVELQFVK